MFPPYHNKFFCRCMIINYYFKNKIGIILKIYYDFLRNINRLCLSLIVVPDRACLLLQLPTIWTSMVIKGAVCFKWFMCLFPRNMLTVTEDVFKYIFTYAQKNPAYIVKIIQKFSIYENYTPILAFVKQKKTEV